MLQATGPGRQVVPGKTAFLMRISIREQLINKRKRFPRAPHWYENCRIRDRLTMTVEGHCSGRKDNRMARRRGRNMAAPSILFKSPRLCVEKEKLFLPSGRIHRWRTQSKSMSKASRPSKEIWQGFCLNANYRYIMIG